MFTLRRNIVLGFGAIALLVGAFLASLWLRQVAVTRSEGARTEFVMAAAGNITPGTLLHLDDMTWIAIDPAAEKRNFIVKGTASAEDYEGALARQPFQAGAPFTSDGLLRSTDRNFLSAVLSPGARALTLPVEAQQSSSGLVRPGDHVDVILTQNLGDAAPDPGHRVVAETLLHDILVVAVERALTPSSSSPQKAAGFSAAATMEAAIPKTITLQVTEEQAQKLLVAAQLGKVDLVERALVMGVTPSLTVRNTWAYDVSPALGALRGKPASQPSQPTPPTAPPSLSAHGTIEVMHGSKVEVR